jgi:hypothetical protein
MQKAHEASPEDTIRRIATQHRRPERAATLSIDVPV